MGGPNWGFAVNTLLRLLPKSTEDQDARGHIRALDGVGLDGCDILSDPGAVVFGFCVSPVPLLDFRAWRLLAKTIFCGGPNRPVRQPTSHSIVGREHAPGVHQQGSDRLA
jgi:hypothetical protein